MTAEVDVRNVAVGRRRAQAGSIGLTDVLLGLAVTAIAMPAVVSITNQQTREVQDQVAAQQLKAVGEATRAYVKDHFASLYAGIFNGSLGGDFLRVGDLAAAGYLPATFTAQNAFKQKMTVLLRIVADTSSSCPTPDLSQMPDGVHCKALLEAVVMTTGGQTLDAARAAHVAVSVGANGGIVADGGTARGAFGSWCEDLSLFGAAQGSASCPRDARPTRSDALANGASGIGQPAQGGLSLGMFFNGSELMSEYLNRFDTGNLEDNTMHADLAMDNHAIKDAAVVQIDGVTQGLDAPRMGLLNDLYDGNFTGNPAAPGSLNARNFIANGSGGGNVTASGAVTANAVYAASFYHSSDASLKTNIRPIADPLRLVASLQGHRFEWKTDGSADIGFVAQEVQKVLPEAVGQMPNGKLTVKYDIIAAPLVEAVKSLSGRLNALERERTGPVVTLPSGSAP